MEHVLKALNLELGFLYNQLDLAKSEIADLKKERDTARDQLKLTSGRVEAAERECAALREQLSKVPTTMSRAEWDAHMDKLHDFKPAGPLEAVNHELS
jgi:predicted  nucleic acid-binding Zn-ribbon protein